MSNQEVALVLEPREIVGKGLGKLKSAGKVPAVIHRPGRDSLIVSGDFTEVTKVFQAAGKHHVISTTIGNEKLMTIIKDIDYEPTKHTIRHLVLGAVKLNEKIETEVPVELAGEAPALKSALLVHQNLDVIEISALPKYLPDSIQVSVESLAEVGDRILVSDIKVPSGVTILTEGDHPVVTVDAPHIQAEEPEESPAAAEAAAIAELTSEEQTAN